MLHLLERPHPPIGDKQLTHVFKVEHVIRDDYTMEAMEMLELLCDLLLARFGLLENRFVYLRCLHILILHVNYFQIAKYLDIATKRF